MNQTEFQESIQAGLGAGILYARANDIRAFRDVILDACLHCDCVAAEMEGTRASYLYELVNLLPDRQFYCDQVLQSLAGSADTWDAVQRFEFAAALAGRGDTGARQALYAAF